jgi:glutathione S-transferase
VYPLTPEGRAPPELAKIHPLGKSPVITDGNLTIAESGAIVGMSTSELVLEVSDPRNLVEHLIHKYGSEKLLPTDTGYVDNLYSSYLLSKLPQ